MIIVVEFNYKFNCGETKSPIFLEKQGFYKYNFNFYSGSFITKVSIKAVV